MAMGQQKHRQGDLLVSWSEMPRSPGHVFYDRLQSVLIEGGFDAFAEDICRRMAKPAPATRLPRLHQSPPCWRRAGSWRRLGRR